MAGNRNTKTLHQAIACFNANDLDGYLQMFQTSVLHHGFSRSIGPGVTGLRNFYRQMTQAFPDARIETDDVIAEDEKLAHRYTFYGMHRGEYLGFPPTHEEGHVRRSGYPPFHGRQINRGVGCGRHSRLADPDRRSQSAFPLAVTDYDGEPFRRHNFPQTPAPGALSRWAMRAARVRRPDFQNPSSLPSD
jgi:predicted ester cyclase